MSNFYRATETILYRPQQTCYLIRYDEEDWFYYEYVDNNSLNTIKETRVLAEKDYIEKHNG